MKRLIAAAVAASALAGAPVPAAAGPATDSFSKCLLSSATPQDRENMIRWVFLAMAAHPSNAKLVNVPASEREKILRDGALAMQRLILVDCRQQAIAAYRADGPAAFEQSFSVLGGAAMEGMMTDRNVTEVMQGLMTYMDKDAWAKMNEEMTR